MKDDIIVMALAKANPLAVPTFGNSAIQGEIKPLDSIVSCPKCNRPLTPLQIETMLGNPAYNKWARLGYCCYSCFQKSQHAEPTGAKPVLYESRKDNPVKECVLALKTGTNEIKSSGTEEVVTDEERAKSSSMSDTPNETSFSDIIFIGGCIACGTAGWHMWGVLGVILLIVAWGCVFFLGMFVLRSVFISFPSYVFRKLKVGNERKVIHDARKQM